MTARVLVVDDILANVRLLEAKLTSEYFDVHTASNGMDALEAITSFNPDIILLDLVLREGSGKVSANTPVLNTRSRAETGTSPRVGPMIRAQQERD